MKLSYLTIFLLSSTTSTTTASNPSKVEKGSGKGSGNGNKNDNYGLYDVVAGPDESNFGPIYGGNTGGNRVDIDNDNNNNNDFNSNESGGGSKEAEANAKVKEAEDNKVSTKSHKSKNGKSNTSGSDNKNDNYGVDDSVLGPDKSNFAPIYGGNTGGNRVDIDTDNNNNNNANKNESENGSSGGGDKKHDKKEDDRKTHGGEKSKGNDRNINLNINAPIIYFDQDLKDSKTNFDPSKKELWSKFHAVFGSVLEKTSDDTKDQNGSEKGKSSKNDKKHDDKHSANEKTLLGSDKKFSSGSNNKNDNYGILDAVLGPYMSNFGPIFNGGTGGNRIDIVNDNNNDNDEDANEDSGSSKSHQILNINLNVNAPVIYFSQSMINSTVTGAGEKLLEKTTSLRKAHAKKMEGSTKQ